MSIHFTIARYFSGSFQCLSAVCPAGFRGGIERQYQRSKISCRKVRNITKTTARNNYHVLVCNVSFKLMVYLPDTPLSQCTGEKLPRWTPVSFSSPGWAPRETWWLIYSILTQVKIESEKIHQGLPRFLYIVNPGENFMYINHPGNFF